MTPLILATCDTNDRQYYLGRAYARAIEHAGGALALALPSAAPSAAALIEGADGLFLTGGDDIHPRHYGEEIAPYYDGTIDEPRYELERALIAGALAKQIPIFGICLGLQSLNVYFGGTLHQDIRAQLPGALPHTLPAGAPRDTLAHPVAIREETRLAAIVGTGTIRVNSIHHQGIKRLAPNLLAAALAPDGLVEAVENPSYPFLLAVQWHPEELTAINPRWKKLFAAFVDATKNRP